MPMRLTHCCLALGLLSCSSCSSRQTSGGRFAVQTERTSYPTPIAWHPSVVIPFVMRNVAEIDVFVAHCGSGLAWTLQQATDTTWTDAFAFECPLILTPPLDLRPGAVAVDTARIGTPNFIPTPGSYRIVVRAFWTRAAAESHRDAQLIPIGQRASNPFRFR